MSPQSSDRCALTCVNAQLDAPCLSQPFLAYLRAGMIYCPHAMIYCLSGKPRLCPDSLSCVALACSGCPHSSQLPSSPWVTTKASASATSPHPLRRHADSIPNLRVQVGTDLCVDFSPRRSSHTYYCALL